MDVLVTGGAGYIGSVVVDALVGAGHGVAVFDNLSRGHARAVPASVELIIGDIGDRGAIDNLFAKRRFDAVMHFAAFMEAGESMRVPERYFRNNSASTLTLLESMVQHRIERFVFSSTAALYGEPQETPIREDAALAPTNAYGESKLLVERMLDWLCRIHGLHYASLRYFNAAGATKLHGEHHQPESHLIPLVLQAASGERDSIAIFGTDYPTKDGTCVRDYIHVEDLAAAHVLALGALGSKDRLIYNVGNGRGFTVREVIDVARHVTGKTIRAVEEPRRPGDPAVLVASSDKIKRELGWQPKRTDLHDIVQSAWEWRQAHPRGYAK
jgi:UDP-glucose 4-epimerase